MLSYFNRQWSSFFNQFYKRSHDRSKRATKNIIASFVAKGFSILISFLIVPITLEYVGEVEYGVWMTIYSIIHWFSFFDIGLGNGLRNKLAEALALNNVKAAKIYISSAFGIITVISALLFIGFFVSSNYISWIRVFNIDILSNSELQKIVRYVFLLFCVGFILNLINSVLQALQKYWLKDTLSVIAQLIGLIGMYGLVKTTDGSLFNLCIVYAGKSPLVMLISGIVLFLGSLRYLKPRILYIRIKIAMPMVNLGFRFFVNQILYLIVTQSSVILVAQFFGPAEVTVYNLAVRYMTIATMIYMMVLTPFLSAFTEAYAKEEYNWIQSSINKINKVWIITSIVTILLIFTYKAFFRIWIGDKIQIPLPLIITLAISGIIHTYYNKYSLFLNGIGRIRLQSYILGLQAVLFIPLSYMFYRLDFRLVSLVASQIIIYTITLFFMRIQYHKIINNTASGIWAK